MYKADYGLYFIFLSMSETDIPVSSDDILVTDLPPAYGSPEEDSHTEETSREE